MSLSFLRPPPLAQSPSYHGGSLPTFRRLRLLRPISAASFSLSSGRASQRPPLSSSRIPARDRVIDFGRHRGKMLGTLPSSYLSWVSKNLRARDYEEWAKLADEVLRDPVYRDRLEWEAAERVLTGAGLRASSPSESAVVELLDISERFGWNNEDKDGWRRVDFQLLGTSKGGRIPRLDSGGGAKNNASDGQKAPSRGGRSKAGFLGMRSCSLAARNLTVSSGKDIQRFDRDSELKGSTKDSGFQSSRRGTTPSFPAIGARNTSIEIASSSEKLLMHTNADCWVHEAKKAAALNGTKVGRLSKGFRFTLEEEEEDSSTEETRNRGKREERREKQKQKRRQQMRMLRREVGLDTDGGDRAVERERTGEDRSGYPKPFPGRAALLGKINRR